MEKDELRDSEVVEKARETGGIGMIIGESPTNKNIFGRKFKLPARTLWSLLVQSNV